MNLPYFISQRISTRKIGTFSSTIHKVAIFSIGVGLAVIIIAFAIMLGFKNTIKDKIYNFSGHIQVTKYVNSNSYNENPLKLPEDFYFEEIAHVVPFAFKWGLIQTEREIEGVAFKGVGNTFDSLNFKKYIKKGKFIAFKKGGYSTEILMSLYEANKLNLDVGGEIIMHFFQKPMRVRKLTVVGIYETGMEEFDKKVLIGDINLARRLNNWLPEYAGGFEIYLQRVDKMDNVQQKIYAKYGYDFHIQKTDDKFLQIFEWLSLIENNVNILLFMVLFVASFNMISIILILILERTPMIGTLKALGATNNFVRKIFVYNGLQMILKGLLIGNFFGLGIALIQWKFKLVTLDSSNYYMSYVPIEFDVLVIGLLNLLVLGLVSLILMLPTLFISRVEPIKAIKFD